MSLPNPFLKVWVDPSLFKRPLSPRPEQSAISAGLILGKHAVAKFYTMDNPDHRQALKNEAWAYIRFHAARLPQDGLTSILSRVSKPNSDSKQRAILTSRIYGPSLMDLIRSPHISDEELAKVTRLSYQSHRAITQRSALLPRDRHGHNMIVTLGGSHRQTPRVVHLDFGTRGLDFFLPLERENYQRQATQLKPALSYPPLMDQDLAAFTQAGLIPANAKNPDVVRSSNYLREHLLRQFREAGRDVPTVLRHFYSTPQNDTSPPQLAPATLGFIADKISRQQAPFSTGL